MEAGGDTKEGRREGTQARVFSSPPSNLRTGGPTNLTTSSPRARTALWWSGMSKANGTTSPATITCLSRARREQVNSCCAPARWGWFNQWLWGWGTRGMSPRSATELFESNSPMFSQERRCCKPASHWSLYELRFLWTSLAMVPFL